MSKFESFYKGKFHQYSHIVKLVTITLPLIVIVSENLSFKKNVEDIVIKTVVSWWYPVDPVQTNEQLLLANFPEVSWHHICQDQLCTLCVEEFPLKCT